MEAIASAERRPFLSVPLSLFAIGAGTGLSALSFAALTLAGRRLTGALAAPYDAPTWLAIGFGLAIALAGIRESARHGFANPRFRQAIRAAAIVMAAIVIAACWLPGTAPLAALSAVAIVVAEEAWSVSPLRRRWRVPSDAAPIDVPRPAADSSAQVVQQLTRRRAADGSDELEGWLRADFPATAKHTTLHVAFCPPFAKSPRITLRQAEGAPASAKAAQTLPHGVRIELKRSQAAEAAWTRLHFLARTDPVE